MAKTTLDTWDPHFLTRSPLLDSIEAVSQPFIVLSKWPTLPQFSSEFAKRNIQSANNVPILPVAQGDAPDSFEQHYEPRIFLRGQLQTRLENWHDYFNAMCWLQFPHTKAVLNSLHVEMAQTRPLGSNRSALENAITLFDECGAVMVVDDDANADLIINHCWQTLFVKNKTDFGRHIQCYVFGHAMHEKSLCAYIGMTTHTIILKKTAEFFEMSYLAQLKEIDKTVAAMWHDKTIVKTKDLYPLPLLGVPGWWHQPQDEVFYNNRDYFRKKRQRA
jgi:Protein of unknown function (DUF3025)